jgi:hypothetical protein
MFKFHSGVVKIQKRAKKYLEKFFELSGINEFIKKQVIRIFYTLAHNDKMENSFGLIVESAIKYAE